MIYNLKHGREQRKKKLRQQRNFRQVSELCGSLWLPCPAALSPVGSGHKTCGHASAPLRAAAPWRGHCLRPTSHIPTRYPPLVECDPTIFQATHSTMARRQLITKSSAIWLAAFCMQSVNTVTKSFQMQYSPWVVIL